MKKQILTLAMLSALVLSAHAQQPANQLLPYQNPNLSAEARANDLLSRLTLEEKTKLMMELRLPSPDWVSLSFNGGTRLCMAWHATDMPRFSLSPCTWLLPGMMPCSIRSLLP